MKTYYIIFISLILNLSLNAQNFQLLNAEGQTIINEKFTKLKYPNSPFVPVQKGELWGILDIQKGSVTNYEYEDIGFNKSIPNLFAVKKDNLWGIINAEGKTLLPCKYEEIKFFDEELAIVSIDFYWVLINFKGEKLVDDEYEHTADFTGKEAIWFKKGSQYDLYNRAGKKLFTQTGWRNLDNETTSGFLQMVTNGWHKTGAFDIKTEKVVVPLQYDKVTIINDDLVEVAKCKIAYDGYGPSPRDGDFLYGIYSASLQKEIVPCTFDDVMVKEKYIKAVMVGYATKGEFYSHQGKKLNPDNIQETNGIKKDDFLEILPMSKKAFAIKRKNYKWGIAHFENNTIKWQAFPTGSIKKVENVKTGETLLPFALFIGYSDTDIYDANGKKISHAPYPIFEKINETATTATYRNYDIKTGKLAYFEFSKDGKVTKKATVKEDNTPIPFQNADKKYGLKKADGTILTPAIHQNIRANQFGEHTVFVTYNQ